MGVVRPTNPAANRIQCPFPNDRTQFHMEHACLLRAATLLDDPLMMEWALHYYADLPSGSELRETLATRWFHDLTLHHWVDDDHEMLGLMMRCLPEKCFKTFLPGIAARWSNSPPSMLDPIARILVVADPVLAAATFIQSLEKNPHSLEHGVAMLSVLDRLPPASALSLFEKLLPLIHGDAGVSQTLLQTPAFGVAVQLNQTGELPTLLDYIFIEDGEEEGEAIAERVGHRLFAHDSYVRHFFLCQSGDLTASFSGLAALLHNDAPIEEMDAALSAEASAGQAMNLLEIHHGRSAQSTLAWDVIRKSKTFQSGAHPQAFAALALAGVAAAFERKTMDVIGQSVEDILGLLCVDISTHIHYETLLRCLRDRPRAEVIDATRKHLVSASNGYGEIVLARLMGDLAWDEFVPTLLMCIAENPGDVTYEAAESALIRIGKPARDAVIVQWDALDASQKISGSLVIQAVGGAAVAEFIIKRSEELLRSNVESWCQFLLAEPDIRLIELVRPELRRRQHNINETFYRLCRLLGVDSPELVDLRANLIADMKIDNQRLASFSDGVLPGPSSSVDLLLRCTSCGHVNYYPVRKVIISCSVSEHPHLLADEFPCLSCGEFVDFKFEAEANFIMMGEVLRDQLASSESSGSRSMILAALKVGLPDGSEQDAPQAYALLQKKVASQPDDWLSWFRLANINTAINRPIAALACLKKAYAINPLSFDTILNLATTLAENNQESAALQLMNTALKSRSQWQTLGFQVNDKVSSFAAIFNQLRGSTGRLDIAALHPQFFKPVVKAGRNDPCPCGSGKKFKKCCMQ